MRGRDIKRYGYDWAELWLINTHNGVRGKIDPININDYPAIKHHLDNYWDKISNRDDQGVTPYNLRNCAYLEDFDKPKIVWTPVNSEYRFAVIPERFVFNNSLFMITGTQYLNFMCCVLNSNVLQLYFSFFTRDNYQYGSGDFFEKIPIPIPTKEIDEKFSQLMTNTIKLNLINNELYSLYGLTAEEIKYIENL